MANHSSYHEVDCERLDITILLVDDDTTTLSLNAGFLRSWQYKVATAKSGHEALKTLKEFKGFFDLVITDLNMREMNGFELQKRVKHEFRIPVIIMSADGSKNVMSRILEHGAAYCLAKPVRREDLKDVWQHAVAGRRDKLKVQNDRLVSVREEEGAEEEERDSPPSPPPKNQRKKYCKRKRSEVTENEELIYCGQKRSKIFWTTNLHNRFLLALNHIGMDKAVPTKILEIMNVPGLTRENVASHLQKYRMFLKRIAEKGILEGLSERSLRSRFAMGLPTDLIRDLQRRVSRLHLHENYHQITQNPPTVRLPLANQTRLLQPYHYGTDNPYRNFQQSHYHDCSPIVNRGGFMTSANGLMSNYSSLGRRNLNYSPTNYDNNNNHGVILPYGSHGLQRSPWTYNNHRGTQLNNNNNNNYNHGMMVSYGSSGLQRSPSSYNNYRGTQLNNNASLTVGNRVQDVGYPSSGHNNDNIFGLLSNGNASKNAVVPVSSSVVNVCVEVNRANVSVGFPSLPQKSNDGIRSNGSGDGNNHNQLEACQMDDLNELFLMINDLVLPDDETAESPRAGVRSSSNILSSFNVEDCIDLLLGDGERSINVLTNKPSSCTNENPNLATRNDASTNLEFLNMMVAEKANNSPSENLTPREQTSHLDWDMDLVETLFNAADPSQE